MMTLHFESYAGAKGPTLPADFMAIAAALKKDISDYRDYEIIARRAGRVSRYRQAAQFEQPQNKKIALKNPASVRQRADKPTSTALPSFPSPPMNYHGTPKR